MTIKHPISKVQWAIVWALNYYLTQLSLGCQSSCQQNCRQLETRCGREATPDQGRPRKPPMEWTPATREQERHNVTVISSGGQNMKFMFGLQHPLTCKPWTTLSNPCNKVRGKYICKEVSRVFIPASFLHASIFLRASVFIIIVSLWCCRWLYNICPLKLIRTFKILCQVVANCDHD